MVASVLFSFRCPNIPAGLLREVICPFLRLRVLSMVVLLLLAAPPGLCSFSPGSAAAQELQTEAAQAREAPAFTAEELAEAAATLRELYYDRAWELAALRGEAFDLKAPDALEVRAWYALSLARGGRVDDAVEVAEDLLERAPDAFWPHFAMAGSIFRHTDRWDEAKEPIQRALELEPGNLDALSLHADILRYTDGEQEAIDYIQSLPSDLGGHPLLQIRKAVALDAIAVEEDDDEAREAALDYFRQVMALDEDFLEPPFFLGTRLRSPEDAEESAALLRRAAELSPSHEVHRYVWRQILAMRDMDEAEKMTLLDEAVAELWERGGKTGGALQAAAGMYDQANRQEVRDSLWNVILAEFPDSPGAEWALVSRYRDLSRRISEATRAGEEPDPKLRAEYRRQLESFLLRPTFHRETLRGDAYRNLLYLLRDEDEVDPEFLYNVVRGVELYEGINTRIIYGMAPTILADHGVYLDYAETLARKGMTEVEKDLEEYRERGIFDTEEQFEAAAGSARASMLDALGWVLFAKGELDDAEGELLRAMQLTDRSTSVYLHLGKLYERRRALALEEGPGNGAIDYLDQALDFYLKGTLVQAMGENPNDEELERLYTERFGSMEGFDEYVATANVDDTEARRAEILAGRLEEPEPVAAFTMATLDGDTLRSEELAGKVVVINFWGTWCGPCVVEMPGIQEFYDRYKDDSRVEVLTLSNDQNLDVLRRFMEKEEYTFPVMLDEGYVDEVKVRAFPTTWFIGPDGMLAFKKRGWSGDLPREFGWRVEALRGGGGPP